MSKEQINELATDIYSMLRSDTMSRAMASMLYDKGWRNQKLLINDVKSNNSEVMSNKPTDVAPRAKVERLTRICESYALQYGTVRDHLPIIKRIGVDAAREIFEAIGAVMKAHSIGDIDDHTLYSYIHTLKEKYTEGEK